VSVQTPKTATSIRNFVDLVARVPNGLVNDLSAVAIIDSALFNIIVYCATKAANMHTQLHVQEHNKN